MAYQKKNHTPEELSRIRSEAGKRGAAALRKSGNYKGGRPKGIANKMPSGIDNETRSIMVRATAHAVFVKCASCMDKSLVDFMSSLAESLKHKNPQVFGLHDNIRV